ncbi:hypothetical protein DPEC_G00202580 [Dallia pectoralis]|uniref:Uncharacterized protein n=1 Tax=Dallia pectoralis TaxID=75939 RepID=A0ACC2G9R1_DALPE|nr:hypothetical protein DPEC_G00202580 [Dallia pectoralis]
MAEALLLLLYWSYYLEASIISQTPEVVTLKAGAIQSELVHTGNGSRVILLTERQRNSTESTTIKILSPSDSDSSPVPLVCLVPELVPSQVRVFWLIDGREETGLTESGWTNNNDSATEFTRNQILVQPEEWDRGAECTCVVEFDGKNITKTTATVNAQCFYMEFLQLLFSPL